MVIVGFIILYILHYFLFFILMRIDNSRSAAVNAIIQKNLYEVYEEYPDLKDTINVLIQFESNKFVVFIDCENDLDWETNDDFDSIVDKSEVQNLLADIDFIQHQAGVNYLTDRTKQDLNWLLGRAVCLIFHSQKEKADQVVSEAKKFLFARKAEITRKWQLTMTICIYFVSVIALCLGKIFESDSGCFWLTEALFIIFIGFTGSCLSVINRTGAIYYDCSSGQWLNFLQVISRFIAGEIGALFVITLYKANLVFSEFQKTDNQEAILIILGIIGGFCERLAPSLIEKFIMEGKK